MVRQRHRSRRAASATRPSEAIARLGIRARGPDDTLEELSGGNQQKVVLARWQAEPCRLLLLDEPFQGVDVGARADLIAAIRGGQQGSATLIATSDAEEALEVADRIFVMRDHTLVGRPATPTARLPFWPRSTGSRRPSRRRADP